MLAIGSLVSFLSVIAANAGVADAESGQGAYSPVVTFATVKESSVLRDDLHRISFSDARLVAYSSTALLVGLRVTIEHLIFTDADGAKRYVWWVIPPTQK